MMGLYPVDLPEGTLTVLKGLQESVNSQATYVEQVSAGKGLFEKHRRRVAFRPVLTALKQMCSGAYRCHYCEDSSATDIEHIWPKEYYPDLVFSWDNYLYGCQRCNRSKASICDIYSLVDGSRLSVAKAVKEHGGPPAAGDPVLINPRVEDPTLFMTLDLKGTFFFMPIETLNPRDWERARHTIDLLKLNEEDVLPAARYEAYENYIARLEKYIHLKVAGATEEALSPIVQSIKKMGHPTVWHEMRRQKSRIPLLDQLFTTAPEAMSW